MLWLSMSHKDRTYILSFDRLVQFLYKYFLQPAIGVSFFSHNELISKTSWKLLYCLLPRLLKWLLLPGMSSITFNTHFIPPTVPQRFNLHHCLQEAIESCQSSPPVEFYLLSACFLKYLYHSTYLIVSED